MSRASLWQILLVAAVMPAACETRSARVEAGGDGGPYGPPAETPYKPSVDEGLGASVAILVDRSGSMGDEVDGVPKWKVARDALAQMLAATDSFAAARPDYPVNIGIYGFNAQVQPLYPMARYDAVRVRSALERLAEPNGSTAIGRALEVARVALYGAGTFRKYIVVVTDGENTAGKDPADVAREIWRRSQRGVPIYFVAFDVAADRFDFVKEVGGEVFAANGAAALRAQLNDIYRSRILAEDTTKAESTTAPNSARGTRTGGN